MKILFKIKRNSDGNFLNNDEFEENGEIFTWEEINLGLKYHITQPISLSLIKYVGVKEYIYNIDENIIKILNRDVIIEDIFNI